MARTTDPRPYQIAVLASLLTYGIGWLDFEVGVGRAVATVAAALAAQFVCTRLWKLPHFDPRSALISGLSLALLLRTSEPGLAAVAAVLAVASKFAIRRGSGQHVFNPSCFALVALLSMSDRVWVSAGQWGSTALFAFAAAGLGRLVLSRSARGDVTWAFLGSYALLLLGRALWLGDPLAIPLHALQNGAFLIFAFFMISDPRTIPASRPGRIAFAALVALGGVFLQYGLYRANPLLWALAGAAPLVPAFDRLLPGDAYRWQRKERTMHLAIRRAALGTGLALALLAAAPEVRAFCGFYVARADARLFNRASQVVLVRDGDRTVITMSNDFQGEPREFAMVIPVPTFVTREQIHVGERALIDHLDAYTAPRLVEYFDPDPCAPPYAPEAARSDFARDKALQEREARAAGVTIEARYTVGEYDILILSAEQSDGLAGWLRGSGYRLPDGAEAVLASYLRQGMHFFVAQVNLEEHARLGYAYLRPLQIAYASPKFVLPIRLGTLNASGPQELFVYALTRKGRVETTNYRTVKLPSGQEIPSYVKDDFGAFYTALFEEQVRREDMRVVFTEYAWDMGWCDPCAADPLSADELRELGVFWQGEAPGGGAGRDVFVTRLHVRYDAERFPADLVLQETGDRTNFQGRFVLRQPWRGEARCAAAAHYRDGLRERQEREAQTLASLTGWSVDEIRRRIGLGGPVVGTEEPWWQRIWE
jgi:Na+-translocating ferredoxin:NAD+ oxidoreductase RnfD subunit